MLEGTYLCTLLEGHPEFYKLLLQRNCNIKKTEPQKCNKTSRCLGGSGETETVSFLTLIN